MMKSLSLNLLQKIIMSHMTFCLIVSYLVVYERYSDVVGLTVYLMFNALFVCFCFWRIRMNVNLMILRSF